MIPFTMPQSGPFGDPLIPVGNPVYFSDDTTLLGYTYTQLGLSIPNGSTTNQKDQIEFLFGVGTVGVALVRLFYITPTDQLIETIPVNKTDSDSFWSDIRGWLFVNNFSDITNNSGGETGIGDLMAYYQLYAPECFLLMFNPEGA